MFDPGYKMKTVFSRTPRWIAPLTVQFYLAGPILLRVHIKTVSLLHSAALAGDNITYVGSDRVPALYRDLLSR